MPIIVKGSDFTPAPEGIHQAVCVDVADLGIVDSAFGKKHKIKLVWEIEAKMDDGRPFTVQKRYNVSLHEKSTLAKDLKAWRGKPFTAEELKGFDVEKVIGAPCTLVIQHSENEGVVYANVASIVKAGEKRLLPSGGYVRHKDRTDKQSQYQQSQGGGDADDGDQIPF